METAEKGLAQTANSRVDSRRHEFRMSTDQSDCILGLSGRKAYAAFALSAWWTVILGVIFVAYIAVWENAPSHFARVILPVILGILGCIGSVAGLVIFFGMLAYLFKCDRPAGIWKILWLIIFFTSGCFGSAVYFFLIYRRQVRGRRETWPTGMA